MTDRIQVAITDGETKWPSWTKQGGGTTYADAGVDTAEGARAVDAIKDAVHRTYRNEVVGDIGGFGGLFSIAAAKQMADPLLASATDGVGTKIQLAKLANKHNTVGIDLVAMCVNDILATGAEPLFFLDYIAVGKLKSASGEQRSFLVSQMAARWRAVRSLAGRCAEHPGVMDPNEYDLSGFTVGIVDRPAMDLGHCARPRWRCLDRTCFFWASFEWRFARARRSARKTRRSTSSLSHAMSLKATACSMHCSNQRVSM